MRTTNSLAPVALFVYNRPWHTRQTLEALQKNELAKDSELFVFSDGPKSDADRKAVQGVRDYVKTTDGFKNVTRIERDNNLGLAKSIISGVTEIVDKYGKIIVLEDDLITSPYFLKYMNEALEFYKNEEKVISIHGYLYPVQTCLPETFFLQGADCWGWGTWKRGWDLFEKDGNSLLAKLREKKLERRFDLDGAYSYTGLLKGQIAGKNDSWAIRWHASAFLRDKLTLYPGRSLVRNIGLDASGTHCAASDIYDTTVSQDAISIKGIRLEEDKNARTSFKKYFNSLKLSFARRAALRINKIVRRT